MEPEPNPIPSASSFALRCFKLEDFELSNKDKLTLKNLNVPVPSNELKRMHVLRQSEILDSFDIDETYDRYTNLAARIFKVPICLISLVDVDRQWFKSRVGLEATETHRDSAFCAYTVLEDSPDVMVVLDATKDPRFHTNPLVVGPPFIRFYAGAAIYVDEVKIGSFCIIDSKPKEDFDLNQKMNMMDIGSIVASMIASRRSKLLDTESDLARLSMSIVYSLKYPLQYLTVISKKLTNIMDQINSVCIQSSDEGGRLPSLVDEFNRTIGDFCSSINHQRVLTESSLALGQSFVNLERGSGDMKKLIHFEKVNMISLITSLQESIQKVHPNVNFDMSLNRRQFTQSAFQLSYPDLIRMIIYSTVFNVIKNSSSFHLMVNFVEAMGLVDGDEDDEDLDKFMQQILNDGMEVMRGNVVFLFTCQSKKSMQELVAAAAGEVAIADYGSFDMEIFNNILGAVNASYKIFISRSTMASEQGGTAAAVCHELSFPCLMPIPRRRHIEPEVSGIASNHNTHAEGSTDEQKNSLVVLVVEDSTSLQKLLARWLRYRGCKVVQASNGKDALDILKTRQPVHIMLLDFLMPTMLGLTCLKEYHSWCHKHQDFSRQTLVVGLSAIATETEQMAGFGYGMHFFCPKPTNTDVLAKILECAQENHTREDIIAAVIKSTMEFTSGIRHPPNAP